MQAIESIEALEAHYGKVSPLALSKVCDHITALYQRWIKASRFMILSTVGPGGTDATPEATVTRSCVLSMRKRFGYRTGRVTIASTLLKI